MLVKSFVGVMVLATVLGAAVTLGGLVLSYAFDLPSGSAVVLLGTVGLPLAAWARHLREGAISPSEPEMGSHRPPERTFQANR